MKKKIAVVLPRKSNKKYSKPAWELNLSTGARRSLGILILCCLGVLTLMSFAAAAGSFGLWWNRLVLGLFGRLGYMMPLILFGAAGLLRCPGEADTFARAWTKRAWLGVLMFLLALAGLWHSLATRVAGVSAVDLGLQGKGAGLVGAVIAMPVVNLFGFWAAGVIFAACLVAGILIGLNLPLLLGHRDEKKKNEASKPAPPGVRINRPEAAAFSSLPVVPAAQTRPATDKAVLTKPSPPADTFPGSVALESRKDWKLPPFDLLDNHDSQVDSGNIEANVHIIQKTLADFGISVEMGEVSVGPTVTQYTLRPATGVKLSQIAALKNDLALALAAPAVRMELPIPGKALVGIEVPNKSTRLVTLREVLQTSDFVDHRSRLAFALGRDVAGRAQIVDLDKMPHLLIAGSTGSGKSVALNTLVISLLYRNTPQDVKLIMVDPKRVEMTMYNGIPHLLTPPITEPEKAVNAFKWLVAEMERRYKLLAEAKKRNIAEYNSATGLAMSYIVIIVDELADLMVVAQAEIEATVVRLAQMARAVGIHLVLATQRPSVDIITGLIKANITSRMAFAVASQIDSRTILDSSGAEQLLGNGDMLFISAEFNKPKRIQGAYVGEKEVTRVVDFFKQQTGAVIYSDEVVQKPQRPLGLPGTEFDSEGDTLLEEARTEVIRSGKASASFLQRRLRVGYARAARLLDLLQEQGIVGPGEGAKPREVYGSRVTNDDDVGREEVAVPWEEVGRL